jgi:hypothetical protein
VVHVIPGYDIYRPEINDDLQRFYDRYCKGIENGWEHDTPPVRLSLLGFEADGSPAKTVVERPEKEWPLARQVNRTLFLDASTMTLVAEPLLEDASTTYEGHSLESSAVGSSSFSRPGSLPFPLSQIVLQAVMYYTSSN